MRTTARMSRMTAQSASERRIKCSFVLDLLVFSSPPIQAQVWKNFRPRLSNLPAAQLAEVQALYNQYKINSFKLTFIPRFNSYDAGSSATNPMPTFCINTDESNVTNASGGYNLTTYDIFMERCGRGAIHIPGDKQFSITQRNPMTWEVDSGELKRFPWTSTQVANIQAFGVDAFIHAPNFPNFAATTEYNVVCELDLSLKGKR